MKRGKSAVTALVFQAHTPVNSSRPMLLACWMRRYYQLMSIISQPFCPCPCSTL